MDQVPTLECSMILEVHQIEQQHMIIVLRSYSFLQIDCLRNYYFEASCLSYTYLAVKLHPSYWFRTSSLAYLLQIDYLRDFDSFLSSPACFSLSGLAKRSGRVVLPLVSPVKALIRPLAKFGLATLE